MITRQGGRRLTDSYSHGKHPLFSIIIATYNSERFLENTIISVTRQNNSSFEVIIVDGGSTDATIDIISKHEQSIDYWISEPDNGISDAFNKGVFFSTGEFINFQGDGDGFTSPEILRKIERLTKDSILVAGRIARVDVTGRTVFLSPKLSANYKLRMLTRMPFPHQGLFMKREYFVRYGMFDTSLRFAMDYELLLRSYSHPERVAVTNDVVARWRIDGKGLSHEKEVFAEYLNIRIKWVTIPATLIKIISWAAKTKHTLTYTILSRR